MTKPLMLALTLALGPGDADAWGAAGHRLIGELAELQLNKDARDEIVRLLALEEASSLGEVANWADEVRNRSTSRWHFVNLPEDCSYQPARDCADGACVIDAIARQVKILRSASPPVERLRALKFLVHLVGDIHQPLHAGRAADKGGNRIQVQAFGRSTNLHAVWDSGLISHRAGGVATLKRDLLDQMDRVDGSGSPTSWAIESCRASKAEEFYGLSRKLAAQYVRDQDGLLVQRLAQAAKRLAGVLNSALAGTPPN